MDDKRYWFKRRRYGWGWIPVTWQGWTVVGAYLLIIVGGGVLLEQASPDSADTIGAFYLLTVVVATFTLIRLGYQKGPKPRWRWGKMPTDNPEEDY